MHDYYAMQIASSYMLGGATATELHFVACIESLLISTLKNAVIWYCPYVV